MAIGLGLCASVASAQLLGGVSMPSVDTGPVGGLVNDVGRAVDGTVREASRTSQRLSPQQVRQAAVPSLDRVAAPNWLKAAPAEVLLQLRNLRLQTLVEQNPAELEMDRQGNPARRGVLLAIDPPSAGLTAATRAGFRIAADETDAQLQMRTVTLAVPRGMSLKQAAAALAKAAPGMEIEYDHIYEPAGGALAASSAALAASAAGTAATARGPLVGMVDGGVASNPAFAAATIEQKGFAGAATATGHGTAVASLIVGAEGRFRGAAPDASLLVADVYGGKSAAGSASVVRRALSWLAAKRPGVVNVSLVGPRNVLVERAIAAVQRMGIKVVAAVGNDGPAAPPLYPASQAGVIAVTGVDGRDRAIIEAGRAAHLDYAAPGADMAAALPGKGYANVRGTSFAAPLVSARLALAGSTARLDAEAKRGHGRIGRGIVCGPCRVDPKALKAK